MAIKIWFQKSFLIYKKSRVHTTAITAIPNIIIITVMVLSMDRPSEDGAHLPWEVSGRAGMKNIMSGMLWLAKSCDNLWRISPSITLSEGEVEFLETQTVVRSSEDCVECWKGFWWVNSEDERVPGWPDVSTINASSLSRSLRLTAHASTWGKFSMIWAQKKIIT